MEQISTIKDGRTVLVQDKGQSYTAQLLCLIVAGYIAHTVYDVYWGPTARVPGPWLARFTRLWELLKVNKGHFEQVNIDLHKKYGPIVRISPNTFSISDPSAIKQIYLGRTTLMKSKFYEPFGDPLDPNLFSETDIKKHAQSRKAVAHLYSMSSLVTYEGSVDRCNVQVCAKLRDFARHRIAFDVPTWMLFYAHDVIGELTFGEAIGMMEKGQDEYGMAESIDRTMAYASRMAVIPELHKWVSWLSRVARLKAPFQTVQKYVLEQIDSRSRGDSAGIDFLTKLLTLRMDDKVTDLDIEKTVSNNIMAGADTTAISLSAVIYSLLKNPGVEANLREEIDTLAAAGKLSYPVTFEQARHMPYLQACIKEALRVHPAVGRPLPRVVPPEGLTIAGQYFPGGAIVGVNSWMAHYNEDIFGRDAAMFRPERWLESDKEKLSVMEQSLLTFGAGVRTCIGKNLSLLEMSKVIPELYRQLEFELSESEGVWSTWNDWFVKPRFKCYVRLREAV
ncbi:cytochrome P450 [Aspergillus sergii]|uniref:Cytochrome P450 n=1 Tax=Aspergillus sergii TaxID=1034303 RepID=A0A5N6X6U2_9EURO|nr:cytochrome P450 [Aspergillus sergii]